MTTKKVPKVREAGKLTRRDFIEAGAVALVSVSALAAGAQAEPDACAVTVERLAQLLEAPETPTAVQDLIRQVVWAIDDGAAGAEMETTPGDITDLESFYAFPDALTFGGAAIPPEAITPEDVRRKLPARLRTMAHWRLGLRHDFDLNDWQREGGKS